jgi:predicted ATPase/DNA-binding SARP family transcriptional activator
MTLEIHLLGPMRASRDGAPIRLPPRSKLPSLWGYLLVHRGRPTPRQLLAYTLWSDEPETEARRNLRQQLHRLQQLLPPPDPGRPWILTDRSSVQWNPMADSWIDVAEFERLSQDPGSRAAAIDLFEGDLVEGIYDDWVFAERERLRELYGQDLRAAIEDEQQRQDFRRAIMYAQRLLRLDPLAEDSYQSLMRLHARSGDRAGVVRVFNACTAVLQRELGVEPSAGTQRAYAECLADQGVEGGPPPPSEEPEKRHNLPTQLTSFVGREAERETVRSLLERARLLTLTGIGGVGKTRLALAAAEDAAERFADGVWWVDLAPLTDPSLLGQAVATAIGLREQSTRPMARALSDAARSKQMLIVLDNCEHLVAACARLAAEMLAESPGLRFLATSTEPLGVPGESVWQVPPLPLPAEPVSESSPESDPRFDDAASVRLFVDRATLALPTFHLTPANRPQVARLCRALDGIPLALELAAARLRMLTLNQLVDRLDDRFRLLAGGSRTALPRHRTMQAVLDWSFGLLTEPERALLRRLSFFVGGFTLESAETVCVGEPIDADQLLHLLSELVDRSLVTVSRTDPRRVRYGTLETVGQYAREKLIESGEADGVRRAFTEYLVGIVERAGEYLLRGPDQEKWFAVIGEEYDNLRSIMSFAASLGDVVTPSRLAGWLWPFWWTHGFVAEGRQWLEGILPRRASLPPELRARVLHAAGRLMVLQGDYDAAASVLEEDLQLYRQLEDLPGAAEGLSSLGMVASYRQDYETADRLWSEALDIYTDLDDRWGVARALNNLGDLAVYRGDYRLALDRLTKSVEVFRELKSTLGESISLINLGRAAFLLGESARAAAFFRDSLRLKLALEDREGIAWNLEGLAGVAGSLGQAERAARLFAAAAALRQAIGIPVAGPDLPLYEHSLAQARALVDPATWQRGWSQGAGMPLDEALAYASSDD